MNPFHFTARNRVLCATLGLLVALPQGAFAAATLNLANTPLVSTTAGNVKPNIIFNLDDSGSMNDIEVPDWAASGTDAERHTFAYNAIHYNSSTYYKPPPKTFNASNISTPFDSQTGADSLTRGADSTAKPNWKAVRDDGFDTGSSAKSNLQDPNTPAYYDTVVPVEYCDTPRLKNCQVGSDATHTYQAVLRWCNSTALTNCQALRTASTYKYARYPGKGTWISTGTVTAGSGTRTVTGITVEGKQIMSGTASASGDGALATQIVAKINACTTVATGNCQIVGFSAAVTSTKIVNITSAHGGLTTAPTVTGGTYTSFTPSAFVASGVTVPGKRIRNTILPNWTTYPYADGSIAHENRIDCSPTGTTTPTAACTYQQEMTNFANWHAYYKSRLQTMKSGVSFAFEELDDNYRIGFATINTKSAAPSAGFMNVADFNPTNKNTWYGKLQLAGGTSSTPLRGAIMKMGRYYANKASGQTEDPVQYSCQQNFAILSTDGYWNTGSESSSYGPFIVDANTGVGNQDSDDSTYSKEKGFWEGSQASTDSLADTAMYYYKTDLRTPGLGNCDYKIGATVIRQVCDNNVFTGTDDQADYQHMVTFTMGLGVDGTLQYQSDYKTAGATSGSDFYDMTASGTPMWGKPSTSGAEVNIDDLWHAAVNGRGYYFSAKDPDAITSGFKKVLDDINSRSASGSSAALTTQEPVAGTDYAFSAGYVSSKWHGNVFALGYLSSGVLDSTPAWCAEDVDAERCQAPKIQGTNSSGLTTCTTPGPFTSCPTGQSLVGSNCVKVILHSCTGTLKNRITSPSSDTRKILMANPLGAGDKLIEFNWTNLGNANFTAVKPYFEEAYLTSKSMSQFAGFTAAQRTMASGANFVNYLRGHYQYDMRDSNTNKLFRYRERVLGDITDFRLVHVGNPAMSYTENNYATYKATSRMGAVYVGSNDGMLHAFQTTGANKGKELWAFIPTSVMSKMWVLGDSNLAKKHLNFVNGKTYQADVFDGSGWRTILVVGLGNGGKGYFALDVTDPQAPKLLWELNENSAGMANVGYAYGQPTVIKVSDGSGGLKWAAVLPSGYNNANGGGYLYLRDALTGASIRTIATGSGSVGSPSGLSEVALWADDRNVTPEAHLAYGGDLDGNVWKFDLDSSNNATLLAQLSSGGTPQPVTTRPELGLIDNNIKVVFVGTGKYLEQGDLTSVGTQSIYALADRSPGFPLTPSNLIQQTLTDTGNYRTVTNATVDWTLPGTYGWRTNLPDPGERVNVAPVLVGGVLLVPTSAPTAADCSSGGYSWLNYLNYKTGGNVPGTTYAAVKQDSIITGVSVYVSPDGKVHVLVSSSTGANGEPTFGGNDGDVLKNLGGTNGPFQQTRVMWRELVQ